MGRREVVGIQYLRGIAALMVVVHHIMFQWLQLSGTFLVSTFYTGVDVFFVISGFVMIYSTDAGRIPATTFLRRRLVRIVPLYWATTAFMIAVLIVTPQLVRSSKLAWPHALASFAFLAAPNPVTGFYVPLVTPGWTLNLEMVFYVLFALAIVLARGRAAVLLGLLAMPLIGLALIGWIARPSGWLGFYTQDLVLEFLIGSVVGVAFLRRPLSVNWRIGLPLLAVALVLLVALPNDLGGSHFVRCGILSGAIVALGVITQMPRMRWLHVLGDISYSLYLSHFFVLSAIAQAWKHLGLHAFPAFFLVSAVGAAATGYLCWRLVEMPLTAWLRRCVGQRDVPVSLQTA